MIRYDWKLDEVLELFNLKFNDLIFKAHVIHRENFNPNHVQLSTLLSIKTGGCPENCSYCPQSAHHQTGLEKSDLMELEEIMENAKKQKILAQVDFEWVRHGEIYTIKIYIKYAR